MSDTLCANCLKAGHRCPAIAIDRELGDPVLCAFCEDGVACPVRKREVDPAFRDRQRRPVLIGEPKPKPPARPRQPRPVAVTVRAERPQEFLQSTARAQLIAAAQKERTIMDTELCTCSKPLHHRGRCLGGGYPKPGQGKKGRARKAAAAAKPNGHAEAAAESGVATLALSERQLVKLFTSWPLEDKVSCVQVWLDGADVDGAL